MPSFDDLLSLGLSPRTAYLYGRALAKMAALLAARGTDLGSATAGQIAGLVEEHFRCTHSVRAQLRGALVAAWDLAERERPPLRAVRVPPKPKVRCRALSAEAAQALEEAAWARDDDPGLAVMLGLYAGLRRAEIAALRWEDVAGDERGYPQWITVYGKGGLVADVPVHPVLARVIARRRRATGWVFPARRPSAGHAHPATIWDYVRLVAGEAGLAYVPTHALRHTMLAECNDRSGDLRATQEIARHSRPETTAGYTRTTSARLRAVCALVDYGRRLDDGGAVAL